MTNFLGGRGDKKLWWDGKKIRGLVEKRICGWVANFIEVELQKMSGGGMAKKRFEMRW